MAESGPKEAIAAGLCAFAEDEAPARRLADALGVALHTGEARSFPDGESLVRVPCRDSSVLLYRSLNDPYRLDPNSRLVEVLLAAAALRDQGARRLVLVAPYLSYMRQDAAFRPGEAVSQRLVGRLIAQAFDAVVSVDPHLHRTKSLADVFLGTEALAVSAAPALAALLRADSVPRDTLLIGPDEESSLLVWSLASALALDCAVAAKTRSGDRGVSVRLPAGPGPNGRPVILVDDVISTGATLVECARAAREAGATRIEALAVHALFPPEREADLRAAGLARGRCTDSLPHPCGTAALAPVLADALRGLVGRAGRR